MIKDSISADDITGTSEVSSGAEETIGGFLKKHRENQGKDLDEIANALHIHASTLMAIEEDNPKALPAEVFTRGFIKNYARYLGLDPDEALVWYIEQSNRSEVISRGNTSVKKLLAGESMAEARVFPMKRLVVFVCMVAAFFIIGYLFFGLLNFSEPPVNSPVKNLPFPLADEQTPLSVPSPDTLKVEGAIENMAAEQTPPLPSESLKAQPLPLTITNAEKTGQPEKKTLPVPEQVRQAGEDRKVDGGQGSRIKAPGVNYVLEARFIETTWLSVRIDKEKNRATTYQPGDYAVWQAGENISLLIGNAGGIVLTLNGKQLPSPGKSQERVLISFPSE